jgi:hypothetical protein
MPLVTVAWVWEGRPVRIRPVIQALKVFGNVLGGLYPGERPLGTLDRRPGVVEARDSACAQIYSRLES